MATLSQNITQAISDFDDIKTAIISKGIAVPANTPTSQYDTLIQSIPSGGGGNETLKALIERPNVSTTISIPEGTTKISSYIFYNFSGLNNVIIPNSIIAIEDYAFYNSGITSITIPNSITTIGAYAFYYSNLTSITIPNTVSRVGSSAFRNCTQLVTANISAKEIQDLAFNLCYNLTTLILGDGVIQLGDRMAYSCENLTTVTIPASITIIQRNNGTTFGNCPNLEYVTIKNGFNANNLYLNNSTKYSVSTIVSWLEALADRTGNPTYTLGIGSDNLAKLTAEQIAIATDKNWNLA